MDVNTNTDNIVVTSKSTEIEVIEPTKVAYPNTNPVLKWVIVGLVSIVLIGAVSAILYYANNPIGQKSNDINTNLSEIETSKDDSDEETEEDATDDTDADADDPTNDTDDQDSDFITETIEVSTYKVTVTYNKEYDLIKSSRVAPLSQNNMDTAEITLILKDTTGNKTDETTHSVIIISPEIYFESYGTTPQDTSSSAISELFIGDTKYIPIYYAMGEGFGGSMFYTGTDSIKVYNDLYVAVKSYSSRAQPWCEEPELECTTAEYNYATTEVDLENAKEIVKKLVIVKK